MQRYLAWRIGRKEYGIGLAIYFAAYLAVYFLVSKPLAELALPAIWILALAVPRLRDIGWSTWWSLGPFGAGFVVGFLNAVVGRATGQVWPVGPILFGVVGIGSLAFIIALAFKTRKATAAEVFS